MQAAQSPVRILEPSRTAAARRGNGSSTVLRKGTQRSPPRPGAAVRGFVSGEWRTPCGCAKCSEEIHEEAGQKRPGVFAFEVQGLRSSEASPKKVCAGS